MLVDQSENLNNTNNTSESVLSKSLQLDWLGQMLASLLWAVSVFVYGISSTGDILQLGAALAWTVANLATLFSRTEKG